MGCGVGVTGSGSEAARGCRGRMGEEVVGGKRSISSDGVFIYFYVRCRVGLLPLAVKRR